MNPFVKDRINYNISLNEKIIKKNEYLNKMPFDGDTCISNEITEAQNIQQLMQSLSKLDLYTILKIMVLKAASFSPTNFNDLLLYGEQSVAFISCLKGEIENLDNIDNTNKSEIEFDLGLEFQEIFFDFGLQLRNSIEQVITIYFFNLFKNLFIEALDFIDCDKIDKCIIPCNDNNIYKNLFMKTVYKSGVKSSNSIKNNLIKNNYKVDEKQVEESIKQFLLDSVPEEINCLINGVKNTEVVKRIRDILKDKTGKDVSSSFLNDLFIDFESYVEFVPVNVGIDANNPCGLVSLENVAKIKLLRKGHSEEEADLIIQTNIEKLGSSLSIVSGLMQNESMYNSNLLFGDNFKNSDITSTLLNESINTIFNSLKLQRNLSAIYKKLYSPIGEVCLAYYKTVGSNVVQITTSQVEDKIKEEISPPEPDLFGIPFLDISFSLEDSFYEKYKLKDYTSVSNYNFSMFDENLIIISQNNIDKFYCDKNNLYMNNSVIRVNQDLDQNYINTYSRNNFTSILSSNGNDPELISQVSINQDSIMNKVYDNFFKIFEKNISADFYFQEFQVDRNNPTNIVLNKSKFNNLDLFNLEIAKQNLKEKLNV